MSGLKTLRLSNNNICPDGAIALFSGLTSLSKLRKLSLSNNSIDVAGVNDQLRDQYRSCKDHNGMNMVM